MAEPNNPLIDFSNSAVELVETEASLHCQDSQREQFADEKT